MLNPLLALALQIAINTTIFYLFYRWVSNTARKREKMRFIYILREMAIRMLTEADAIEVKDRRSAMQYAHALGYVKAYEVLIPKLEKEVYGESKTDHGNSKGAKQSLMGRLASRLRALF